MKICATVVIPAKDRHDLVQRAVKSVIALDHKKIVEIIVVDDGSDVKIPKFDCMREWDSVIRLEKNSGGAVARNLGIKCAKGEIIYLLDSDDYFIEMDFEEDFKNAKKNHLYYVDVKIKNKKSNFPESFELKNFFDYIFFKHVGICQTSSLMFVKDDFFIFDEKLPKHQDWDLILTALLRGVHPLKKNGVIYIDWQDSNSISRQYKPSKSNLWINKILGCKKITNLNKNYLELMCKDTIENKVFMVLCFYVFMFFLKGKIPLKKSLGIIYRNFLRSIS